MRGIVVDDLRGLTLLCLWFDKGNRNKPFYIGNKVVCILTRLFVSMVYILLTIQLSECDERLLGIDSMS